jgi:hypothetical protein
MMNRNNNEWVQTALLALAQLSEGGHQPRRLLAVLRAAS